MTRSSANLGEVNAISKDDALPYHAQLRTLLSREISKSTWKPGTQIPSEPELCRIYDVSRTVVRQALSDLVDEGKLIRRKGKGTFVAKPKISERLMQDLAGLYEETRSLGQTLRTEVLRFERTAPPDHVREILALPDDQDVIVLDRLRFINNEPRSLVVTFLPFHSVPLLLNDDLQNESLYALLENKYGLQIVSGHRTVEAIPATRRAAELLQLEEGDPVLFLKSVSYLDTGEVIEYFEAQHPGNRSRFEVNLIRQRSH